MKGVRRGAPKFPAIDQVYAIAMGKRIRMSREFLGMSAADLAKKIGVTSSCLCMIERGSTLPSITLAVAIIKELDCSYSWFFDEKPTELDQYKYLDQCFGGRANVAKVAAVLRETLNGR